MNGCRSVEYFYSTPWVETHHRIIQKPSPISLLKSDVDFALTCFEASLFEDFFFSSRNKWLTQMESSSFSSPFKDIERGLAKEMWTSKTIRKQTHGDYSYVAEIQYKQDHVLHDLADRVAAMEIALNKLTKSPIPSPNSTINKSFKKEWQTENGGKAMFSYKYEAKSPEEGEVKTVKIEKFKLSKSAKPKESQIRIIPVEEEDANNNMDTEASRKIQVIHPCEYHVCTISGSLIGFIVVLLVGRQRIYSNLQSSKLEQVVHSCEYHVCTISRSLIAFIVVLLVWTPKDFFKFTVEQIGTGGSFLRISCVHNIWIVYRIYCGIACLAARGFLQIYSRANWNRMALLLGPPGSGKMTLLLALAGKLDSSLKVKGEVTYNGHWMEEFVPQKTFVCISQHDLHVGKMTVREIIDFSPRCQGVGDRYELLSKLARREKKVGIFPEAEVDLFMKVSFNA